MLVNPYRPGIFALSLTRVVQIRTAYAMTATHLITADSGVIMTSYEVIKSILLDKTVIINISIKFEGITTRLKKLHGKIYVC